MPKSVRKKNVAFIISQMDGMYAVPLWHGVMDVMENSDINLFYFEGKSLDSPIENDFQHNVIYDYLNSGELDGIILSSASIANFIKKDRFLDFVKKFKNISIVSLSMSIKGAYSVRIDNKAGMKQSIVHLIEKHGRRRIVFIKGCEGNEEAMLRYDAYTEALSDYGIPFDPDLVLPGDFQPVSGTRAIEILLDERKTDFDAVVASNDDMVVRAFNLLLERGYKIPHDVSMAGFDDVELMKHLSVPFTTVAQPLFKLGQTSAKMMIDILNGKNVSNNVLLPAELIIRNSCGCILSELPGFTPEIADTVSKDNVDLQIENNRELIISEIYKSIHIEDVKAIEYKKFTNRMIDALILDIKESCKSKHFFKVFTNIAIHYRDENKFHSIDFIPTNDFHDFLDNSLIIFYHSIHNLITDHKVWFIFEGMMHEARVLINKAIQNREVRGAREISLLLWDTRAFIHKINCITDIDSLIKELPDALMGPGAINSCSIYLYQENRGGIRDENWVLPEYMELVTCFIEKKNVRIPKQNRIQKTSELISKFKLKPGKSRGYLIKPLFSEAYHFGIIVFEVGSVIELTYETIRENISNALWRIMLFEKLKDTQVQLIQKEKMASLGTMIAGIVHEINNPISFMKTYLELLLQNNAGMIEFFKGPFNKMLEGIPDDNLYNSILGLIEKNKLYEKINKSGEMVDDLSVGVKRIIEIINNLKNFSRLGESEKKREDVNNCIDSTINIIPKTFLKKIQIKKTYESLPYILCYPSQLNQVFLNLLMNAVQAMQGDGKIQIVSEIKNKNIEVSIRDNGPGIPEKIINKIFDPFFTTKAEGKGTGLGLSICYTILERHDGRIEVESKEGYGSVFKLYLPLGEAYNE